MSSEVNWKILFLIGISAGIIASVFPRLLPYMSQAASDVSVELFTERFYYAVAGFSSMIGVAMIWLYKDTHEHTKNLFLSALALPAVLSGGINMASVSSVAEKDLTELDRQNKTLLQRLEGSGGINTFELDLSDFNPVEVSYLPALEIIGISTAHAAGLIEENNQGSSVKFNAPSLNQNYTLIYESADTREEIVQKMETLKQKNITNLTPVEVNNKFYLLQNERKTRAQAVIEAIDIKDKLGYTPGVVELK